MRLWWVSDPIQSSSTLRAVADHLMRTSTPWQGKHQLSQIQLTMLLEVKPIPTVSDSHPVPSETVTLALWCQGHRLLPELCLHCWANTAGVTGSVLASWRGGTSLAESLWPQLSLLMKKEWGLGMLLLLIAYWLKSMCPLIKGHMSFTKPECRQGFVLWVST